jgi:membrane protease subunit HflK
LSPPLANIHTPLGRHCDDRAFPIQRLEKLDTQQIRTTPIGSSKSSNDNLVLTKDQNIIDMAYDVRWSIKSPERFLFQLDQPEQTVQEVSESAMRATVANFNLTQAIGDGRAEIEGQVLERMQAILDEYRGRRSGTERFNSAV